MQHAKRPKGLDGREEPDHFFYMSNYMLGEVKNLHSSTYLKPFGLQIKNLRVALGVKNLGIKLSIFDFSEI